ncbi:hypothetical protein CEXT_209991 [Caerostris extrusa]|uniref:Uncharacterized protein n=1 Tax=Caerostris extrusa TaxID=172846 RepID=A0AAV4RYP9_CAEEX|nr:hypothetical protein CEXT_209991 [Caerostris extrusa]
MRNSKADAFQMRCSLLRSGDEGHLQIEHEQWCSCRGGDAFKMSVAHQMRGRLPDEMTTPDEVSRLSPDEVSLPPGSGDSFPDGV